MPLQEQNKSNPWYKKPKGLSASEQAKPSSPPPNAPVSPTQIFKRSALLLLALACAFIAGWATDHFVLSGQYESFVGKAGVLIAAFFLLILGLSLLLKHVGYVCISLVPDRCKNQSPAHIGIQFLQGVIEPEKQRFGTPAPEMALQHFLQQVRAYASEKSYLKNRPQAATNGHVTPLSPLSSDPEAILRRRWNDVLASLDEFEIYLANDPQGMIENFVAKSPAQHMDVSRIFREVAETFDTTWRKKGVNIEHAIVTPLKAYTNEMLLRRLLVGPWRSCVLFARRGQGVIFAAQAVGGKVCARWQCEGATFPEDFFRITADSSLSVNERIEWGDASHHKRSQ